MASLLPATLRDMLGLTEGEQSQQLSKQDEGKGGDLRADSDKLKQPLKEQKLRQDETLPGLSVAPQQQLSGLDLPVHPSVDELRDSSIKAAQVDVIEGDVEISRVAQPLKVQEQIRTVETVKVQPVIHRQREQTEVRQIIQPMKEVDIEPAFVAKIEGESVDLGARFVPSTLQPSRALGQAPEIENSTRIMETEVTRQVLPPRIEETVHKHIVEQVQPVLIKEIIKPMTIEETKHIYETVVEQPIITHEVREVIEGPVLLKVSPEVIVADMRDSEVNNYSSNLSGAQLAAESELKAGGDLKLQQGQQEKKLGKNAQKRNRRRSQKKSKEGDVSLPGQAV